MEVPVPGRAARASREGAQPCPEQAYGSIRWREFLYETLRPLMFTWILGLPGVGLAFHLWWCGRHGIDPLTAEPRERYNELRGWERP